MEEKLQAIKSALKVAFDVDYEVEVRKDHAHGYVADAHAGRAAADRVAEDDNYFFSYGSTKKSAVKGLATAIEETIRCRLDKFKTGLNTLLG